MAEPVDAFAVDVPPPVRPRRPGRSGRLRRIGWPLALVLVGVALAIADIFVINPFGAASRHPAARAAGPGGGAAHRHSAPGRPSSARTGQASPSASPSPRVLVPVSASAFGPSGNGSGDNPQGAALAIDGSAVTAWRSSWYRSAAFGNLQAGTGLLIDMGHPVRITRVRIVLDAARGANLELLTGSCPSCRYLPGGHLQRPAEGTR